MNREILYRNIAVVGSLLFIVNILVIQQIDQFNNAYSFIDLILKPITYLFAAFWLKKRIAIAGILFISLGISFEIIFNYSPNITIQDSIPVQVTERVISSIGLILMMLALAIKSEKNWIMERIKRIELYGTLTLILCPLITYLILLAI